MSNLRDLVIVRPDTYKKNVSNEKLARNPAITRHPRQQKGVKSNTSRLEVDAPGRPRVDLMLIWEAMGSYFSCAERNQLGLLCGQINRADWAAGRAKLRGVLVRPRNYPGPAEDAGPALANIGPALRQPFAGINRCKEYDMQSLQSQDASSVLGQRR